MMQWLKQMRQTRTPVHSSASQQEERASGLRISYQALSAVQLTLQLLLWVVLWAYDATQQTVWQSTVLTAVPLVILWLLWRRAEAAEENPANGWIALLLLPCLWADLYLMMQASGALMYSMIPEFPAWARVLLLTLFPLATLLLGRSRGAAYGAYTLRFVLLGLFALSTVLLLSDVRVERLWPLLGKGAANTAFSALWGGGAVWGVALLFLLPRSDRQRGMTPAKPTGAFFVWLPLALCVLWALWMAMLEPWRPDQGLTIGQKLVGMSRFSGSILIAETGALFWMLLLPTGMMGALTAGNQLLREVFPKLPALVGALITIGPGVVLVCIYQTELAPFLTDLLPYRFALSLAAGLLLCLRAGKEKKT
ncbi:MAG: hypothetical protein PHI98_11560 [Eubacteriales bacterium]|nr:hypothetical protein [Eubacteriales bacterium]